MAINKVIYGSETLIDLTGDTVEPAKLLSGATAHDKTGETIEGTCTFDVDSTDGTVAVGEILEGKTAYARGVKLTGTMPNKGKTDGTISSADEKFYIPTGFHDGSGSVSISPDEQAKLIDSNIKSGVEILGVIGSYGGEEVTAQTKTVTPSTAVQTVLPDSGYDYLSQVTVSAIPYKESDNAAGGTTVTIGE